MSRFIPNAPRVGRAFKGEPVIVLVFFALAVLMTWPWAWVIRDAVPDVGDPYLVAWIMWWDYFQTFRDPLNLFQAPIFYPYPDALAFSEHNYGIALPFFPLYALGLSPLTIQGVATITGFALCGYGAFRLGRTTTGSTGAAWVAGVVYGFAQYRFHKLSHLPYLFAVWIPLLLEALVLFARRRTWRRAAWLGAAFLMNALTVIHWFVLTTIPLLVSGLYLLTRYRAWGDRRLWIRGGIALGGAALLLLPFLLPYRRVANTYGLVRGASEAAVYSARVENWLTADERNIFWRGFGPVPESGERALFPGALPLLLLLAALLLPFTTTTTRRPPNAQPDSPYTGRARWLPHALDILTLGALVTAALAYGYQGRGIRLFGVEALRVTKPDLPLVVFITALVARLSAAYPAAFRFRGDENLIETVRSARRPEAFALGLVWTALGFFGSLGLNFFFHRVLFEHVFLFRSIRAPARWAMIAVLGLALLAAVGARNLIERIARRKPRLSPAYLYAFLCLLLLFESRAAPLRLVRGEADPDPLSIHMKQTPMRGGLVHLPTGGEYNNHRYVLRQADHRKPLITAVSGFSLPLQVEIETRWRERPISLEFLDLLESAPASYLAVHPSAMRPDDLAATNDLLSRGLAEGRLRFIRSFTGTGIEGNDGAQLFALTRVEPEAASAEPVPTHLATQPLDRLLEDDPTALFIEPFFDKLSYPLHLFYLTSYGRPPLHDEFMADARFIARDVTPLRSNVEPMLERRFDEFAAQWVERPSFKEAHEETDGRPFIERLLANAGLEATEETVSAIERSAAGAERPRASALRQVVARAVAARSDYADALVRAHYFAFLRRDPGTPPDRNLDGYRFWLGEFARTRDRRTVTNAFKASGEYRDSIRDGRWRR